MLFKGLRRNVIPRGKKGREIVKRFEDDNVCRRCGKCCHQGFIIRGRFVLVPELPCKHLIHNGNGSYHCEVYQTRNTVEWCNPCNEKTVKQGLFPPDCSYVEGVVNYHGKMLAPEEDKEQINKSLRRIVRDMPRPEYIKVSDWSKFLKSIK